MNPSTRGSTALPVVRPIRPDQVLGPAAKESALHDFRRCRVGPFRSRESIRARPVGRFEGVLGGQDPAGHFFSRGGGAIPHGDGYFARSAHRFFVSSGLFVAVDNSDYRSRASGVLAGLADGIGFSGCFIP
jgi:hypothetical protein